jgi:hypothetical protein
MNDADWFAAIFVAGIFLTLFGWLFIESWRVNNAEKKF